MSEIFEIIMLITFGFSWPAAVLKSYKSRTTKGKSLFFLCMILTGYSCGVVSKLTNPEGFKWYVLFFYILNFLMVATDLVLYFRNAHLDKKRAEEASK